MFLSSIFSHFQKVDHLDWKYTVSYKPAVIWSTPVYLHQHTRCTCTPFSRASLLKSFSFVFHPFHFFFWHKHPNWRPSLGFFWQGRATKVDSWKKPSMRSISGAEILHERCMHPLFYRTIVKIGKMLPNHHIKSTSCTSKFWKGDSGVVYMAECTFMSS